MSTDNEYLRGKILLSIARAAIAEVLGLPFEKTSEEADWLQQKAACFVTLSQNGQLRGCIGTLEAQRSLLDDVKANAIAAALKDTRFPPLSSKELNHTDIEVSLLSPMQALNFASEEQALRQLRPGIDGVVFACGQYRSTFLPQVWQQLPDTKTFMAHLKQKAGLSPDFWAEDVKLYRYTVTKWKEAEFDEPALSAQQTEEVS
jgi:AmmeMemoRadiSam system protein A